MKARIVKDNCGYYTGEVYGTWTNVWTHKECTEWKCVTHSCLTKWGARRELEEWKRKNCPEEFEL